MILQGLCVLPLITGVLSCKNSTNTAGLLDASFVASFRLYMSVRGDVIYDGKDFDMRLEAKPTATSQPLRSVNGSITWTYTGTGTLTIVSCPEMRGGVQICKMHYTGGLSAGQTKLIKLQAVHEGSKESTAESFTVATQTFSVSIPARVTVNTPFTATVTATDPTGATNTNYTGTVVPYLTMMPGRPNIDEISNFENGVATLQMKIYKPASRMQVVVYDKVYPTFSGTSNVFRVIQNNENYLGLDLLAAPLSAASIRLTWTYLDSSVVNQYAIYRKDDQGAYQLLFTENTTSKSYYLDTDLTAGTTYFYKVDALDSGGNIISTDFASGTPRAPTIISAGYTVATTLTKAQSPYQITNNVVFVAPLILEAGTVVLVNSGVLVRSSNLLQLNGTPGNWVIITSASATPTPPATVASATEWSAFPFQPGSFPTASSVDMNGNYYGGSYFKYAVIEYASGPYWQQPVYYASCIWRYGSGHALERIGSPYAVNSVFDGGVFARNNAGLQIFHAQASLIRNVAFFRNQSVFGTVHAKIDNTDTSPIDIRITGNYFALNSAITPTGTGTLPVPGGAITADPQSTNVSMAITGTLEISDNQFFSNQATQAGANQGGAIRLNLRGTPAYQITNNSFVSNSATTGGAVSFDVASSNNTLAVTGLTLTNNYFSANTATSGGAINFGNTVGTPNNLTITGNLFTGNTAATNGGAIIFQGNSATNVNLGSNFFTSNTATSGSGGALFFSSISATGFSASSNHFSGNTAPGATGSRNIFNNTAASLSFLNAYFEGSTYATCDAARGTNLGIADQCSGVGSNTTTITGVTATAYTLPALCINDPAVAGCVGAR